MWYDRDANELILSERNAERFSEMLAGGFRTSFKTPRDREGDFGLLLTQVAVASEARVEVGSVRVDLTPEDVQRAMAEGTVELEGFTLTVESDEDHYAPGIPVDRRSFELLPEDEQARYRS